VSDLNELSHIDPATKAKVLLEALPYVQKFRDSLFVVKYGGSFLDENNLEMQRRVAMDIVFLSSVGIRVALVHGGGKAITRALSQSGIETRFVNGLRYTDEATIKVVEQTLNGEVNEQICKTIKDAGGIPAPTHGQRVFACEKLAFDHSGDPVELGFVGSITSVSPFEVKAPLSERRIPVISCIAVDDAGHVFNTNADVAAAHLASSLGARRLVYLCDVPGLLQNPQDSSSLISTLPLGDIERLKSSGIISSGMVPKVDGAAHAIREGVRRVHFVDANQPHSLLLEIFTHTGIGTELVLD
jgi:acetylglutamate kinase